MSSGAPANSGITVKYYADASNLKLDIGNGDIDVAFPSLSATDIADLRTNDKVQGRRRPRWRHPLHRLQLQHDAVRRDDDRGRPGQGARRPPGRGRPRSTARRSRRMSTRTPSRRCTRTSRRASPAPTSRSRACTATATADRASTRPRRPSRRRRHHAGRAQPAVQRRPLRPVVG